MMDDDLACRFCSRPCANGTGRAAHERHYPQRDSPAVCTRCHGDYPRGELAAHLKVCSARATAELGRATPAPKVAKSISDLVVTVTITGDPRQIEDALRKLRA